MIKQIVKEIVVRYYAKKKYTYVSSQSRVSVGMIKKNIEDHVYIDKKVKFYSNKSCIGRYTYISSGYIYNAVIGRFCSIANDVCIGPGEHRITAISSYPMLNRVWHEDAKYEFIDAPTIIGNDVWIGHGVTVQCGVKIGDGAIIGSGAVVTKNIPAYAIAVGIPARVIRYRFDEKTVSNLMQLKWWEKDDMWLNEHKELFCHEASDIDLDNIEC